MSGIAGVDAGRTIEGGVGQTVVQMKSKKGIDNSRKGGRFDTMRDSTGMALKTESGLTVINTNRKLEKVVSHELNVAKVRWLLLSFFRLFHSLHK